MHRLLTSVRRLLLLLLRRGGRHRCAFLLSGQLAATGASGHFVVSISVFALLLVLLFVLVLVLLVTAHAFLQRSGRRKVLKQNDKLEQF